MSNINLISIIIDDKFSSNAKNTLSLYFTSISAPVLVSVVEEVEGVKVLLAQYLLSQGGQGSVSLDFVPKGTAVAVHLSHYSMATAVLIDKICVSIPVMQSETYLVELCDEEEDRYRFGYNTQEKVNEISGIGNHYTAEFWEYDTRVARRWNLDPVDHISISSYSVFGLKPIVNVDPGGDYFFGLIGSTSEQRRNAALFASETGGVVKNKHKKSISVTFYSQVKSDETVQTEWGESPVVIGTKHTVGFTPSDGFDFGDKNLNAEFEENYRQI